MRKKKRGGGKQERDLITVGSKGIKTEMREICVIAPLSWINTNRRRCSVCHVVQLRCVPCLHVDRSIVTSCAVLATL